MSTDPLLERLRSIAQTNYPMLKDKLSSVEQVFVLQLKDGGSYVIRANNADIQVDPGTYESPAATMIISSADLLGILDGQLDATKAFFQGRIQIKGDVFKTMALNSLLKGVH
ncbi:MAG TPA: SCP2 sterol-binding domain-containing protein [Conexivisphaerales archaeon]|nr:SCP2 sterol-binding domain-containing protein [Conexivisphaerales archaeon]